MRKNYALKRFIPNRKIASTKFAGSLLVLAKRLGQRNRAPYSLAAQTLIAD